MPVPGWQWPVKPYALLVCPAAVPPAAGRQEVSKCEHAREAAPAGRHVSAVASLPQKLGDAPEVPAEASRHL